MIPEFQGRKLVIATMHGKDRVMRSLLEQKLGVIVSATTQLNTDLLGTFSGEIERSGSPVEVAKRKCELALDETGFDLAVASEGSFGPHPLIFGVPINEEMVLLYDRSQKITCIGKSISIETNFSHAFVDSLEALASFAKSVQFPEHALILKNDQENPAEWIKGIQDYQQLKDAFLQLQNKYGTVYAETDMRAMFNPTRMKVIEEATSAMIDSLLNRCPSCAALYFQLSEVEYGLPCGWCGSSTRSILAHQYACLKCGFKERKLYPKNKNVEDPMYCDYCNP
jgi:predicted RNA-binding Zn-ribbon protein involved in translation (DUF1610 family)